MEILQHIQRKQEQHSQTLVQPALEIGKEDDEQEKEADTVAGNVMRMSSGNGNDDGKGISTGTKVQKMTEPAAKNSGTMHTGKPVIQKVSAQNQSGINVPASVEKQIIRKQPGNNPPINYLSDILKLHPEIDPANYMELPESEIILTKEYKDLMNTSYVWQRDFQLTHEQALGICYMLLGKLANNEPFEWRSDARTSIKEFLETPTAPGQVTDPVSADPVVTSPEVTPPVVTDPVSTDPVAKQPAMDYNKLLSDKKLDIGIGVGYEFAGEKPLFFNEVKLIEDLLISKGIVVNKTASSDGKTILEGKIKMPDPDGITPTIDVDVKVTMVSSLDKSASKDFGEMLSSSEVVVYSGHARHGVGPDFDQKWFHKKGNFKIQSPKKGDNDLKKLSTEGKFDPDKYQVWFFNACTSIDYLDEINADVKDKSGNVKPEENLAVIASKNPVMNDSRPFLSGLLDGLSMDEILKNINAEEHKVQVEVEKNRKLQHPGKKDKPTYSDSFKAY
jgi:hypothetical protein